VRCPRGMLNSGDWPLIGRLVATTQVETLVINHTGIQTEQIQQMSSALPEASHGQLRTLSFQRNSIDAPAFEALLTSPLATQLHTLDLSQNPIGGTFNNEPDGRWIACLEEHAPPTLRVLLLRQAWLRLTPQHAMTLAASERLAKLDLLNIWGNPMLVDYVPGTAAQRLLIEHAPFEVQV